MNTEMALTARRFALTLAVAGIATLGSVALAPAASAAEEVSTSVTEIVDVKGPDAFVEREHGRVALFLCDDEKPKKQHNKCLDVTGPSRF